jgi:hypothetical protein
VYKVHSLSACNDIGGKDNNFRKDLLRECEFELRRILRASDPLREEVTDNLKVLCFIEDSSAMTLTCDGHDVSIAENCRMYTCLAISAGL